MFHRESCLRSIHRAQNRAHGGGYAGASPYDSLGLFLNIIMYINILGRLGRCYVVLGGVLGCLGSALGLSCGRSRLSEGVLGSSWRRLGPSWGHLGPSLSLSLTLLSQLPRSFTFTTVSGRGSATCKAPATRFNIGYVATRVFFFFRRTELGFPTALGVPNAIGWADPAHPIQTIK